MYDVIKREVSAIKNYHGYPGYGKETRWYITYNGEIITDVYNENAPLWFYRKKDAKAYIKEVLTYDGVLP